MVYARKRRYRNFPKKAYKKASRRKYKRRYNKNRSSKKYPNRRIGRVKKVISKMIARTNPMKTIYG